MAYIINQVLYQSHTLKNMNYYFIFQVHNILKILEFNFLLMILLITIYQDELKHRFEIINRFQRE